MRNPGERKSAVDRSLLCCARPSPGHVQWRRLLFRRRDLAHSVQYLLIVGFVHARDYSGSPGSSRGPLYHMATFYLLSILLGIFLFLAVPPVLCVFGGWVDQEWDPVQCFLMVVIAINLHHFIVDGYIWRSWKPQPGSEATATSPHTAQI